VEEPARTAVAALLEELSLSVPGVRWARPDGVHLTLHFFGALPVEQHAVALEAAQETVAGVASFPVGLARLGRFPPTGPARVVWLGVGEGDPALGQLAARCRAAVASRGFEPERRPWRGHCTLGRPRGPLTAAAREALTASAERTLPAFIARRLVLFESHPAPGGAHYLPLGAAELERSVPLS